MKYLVFCVFAIGFIVPAIGGYKKIYKQDLTGITQYHKPIAVIK